MLQGWYEALRVEVYDDNIGVTLACPGPVFSGLLKVAFTGDPNKVMCQIETKLPVHSKTLGKEAQYKHVCLLITYNRMKHLERIIIHANNYRGSKYFFKIIHVCYYNFLIGVWYRHAVWGEAYDNGAMCGAYGHRHSQQTTRSLGLTTPTTAYDIPGPIHTLTR